MKNTFLNLQLAGLLCLVQLNLFSQNVGNTAYINVNKIYLPFNREGVIADVNAYPLGQGGHFEDDYVLYSAGF